jgi:hypothetical protein
MEKAGAFFFFLLSFFLACPRKDHIIQRVYYVLLLVQHPMYNKELILDMFHVFGRTSMHCHCLLYYYYLLL